MFETAAAGMCPNEVNEGINAPKNGEPEEAGSPTSNSEAKRPLQGTNQGIAGRTLLKANNILRVGSFKHTGSLEKCNVNCMTVQVILLL